MRVTVIVMQMVEKETKKSNTSLRTSTIPRWVDKRVVKSCFLEHDLLVILKKIIGLPRCSNVI